jgi:hypothetical protein
VPSRHPHSNLQQSHNAEGRLLSHGVLLSFLLLLSSLMVLLLFLLALPFLLLLLPGGLLNRSYWVCVW